MPHAWEWNEQKHQIKADEIEATLKRARKAQRGRSNHLTSYSPSLDLLQSGVFTFDKIYSPTTSTETVYSLTAKPIILAAMSGFHGSVLAYGQTNTGKTFTMQGTNQEPGIVPLAIHDCFECIGSSEQNNREFLLRVSYMELYNEIIKDLLAPTVESISCHKPLNKESKIRILNDRKKGVVVRGLKEKIVTSPEEVLQLISLGEAKRQVGQTEANMESSRSHTIFRLTVESRIKSMPSTLSSKITDSGVTNELYLERQPKQQVLVSTLQLVDLAGSESVRQAGTKGHRLREGSFINRSLLTLGTVIRKLSDTTCINSVVPAKAQNGGKISGHSNINHVPYRDSKLTRLLQPSLGGNAHVALICTLTPAAASFEESLNTLKFAARAKLVEQSAAINEVSEKDSTMIKAYKDEIARLKTELIEAQTTAEKNHVINQRQISADTNTAGGKYHTTVLDYKEQREKCLISRSAESKKGVSTDHQNVSKDEAVINYQRGKGNFPVNYEHETFRSVARREADTNSLQDLVKAIHNLENLFLDDRSRAVRAAALQSTLRSKTTSKKGHLVRTPDFFENLKSISGVIDYTSSSLNSHIHTPEHVSTESSAEKPRTCLEIAMQPEERKRKIFLLGYACQAPPDPGPKGNDEDEGKAAVNQSQKEDSTEWSAGRDLFTDKSIPIDRNHTVMSWSIEQQNECSSPSSGTRAPSSTPAHSVRLRTPDSAIVDTALQQTRTLNAAPSPIPKYPSSGDIEEIGESPQSPPITARRHTIIDRNRRYARDGIYWTSDNRPYNKAEMSLNPGINSTPHKEMNDISFDEWNEAISALHDPLGIAKHNEKEAAVHTSIKTEDNSRRCEKALRKDVDILKEPCFQRSCCDSDGKSTPNCPTILSEEHLLSKELKSSSPCGSPLLSSKLLRDRSDTNRQNTIEKFEEVPDPNEQAIRICDASNNSKVYCEHPINDNEKLQSPKLVWERNREPPERCSNYSKQMCSIEISKSSNESPVRSSVTSTKASPPRKTMYRWKDQENKHKRSKSAPRCLQTIPYSHISTCRACPLLSSQLQATKKPNCQQENVIAELDRICTILKRVLLTSNFGYKQKDPVTRSIMQPAHKRFRKLPYGERGLALFRKSNFEFTACAERENIAPISQRTSISAITAHTTKTSSFHKESSRSDEQYIAVIKSLRTQLQEQMRANSLQLADSLHLEQQLKEKTIALESCLSAVEVCKVQYTEMHSRNCELVQEMHRLRHILRVREIELVQLRRSRRSDEEISNLPCTNELFGQT